MFASSFSRSFREGERPGITQTIIANSANIWYDASTPAYFTPTNPTNNASLSNWNDRSLGHSAHNAAPSGGANKPTYVTPALNGYGAVNFSGTQNLQINAGPTPNWVANQSSYSLFFVAKLNTNTTGVRTLSNSDTNGYKIQYSSGTWSVSTAGGTGTVALTADNNWHLISMTFKGANADNGTRLRFRYDSVDRPLSFAVGQTVGTATNSSSRALNFGWDGTGNYWLGQIAEVLLFTSAQDSTQTGLIEGYLKNKWAI